ncbi:MAG: chromosome segregation protein SMC [Clostridiales Family XIII bacterium]|jgi:chromosome segregation protein|nr:chromosome segregation protein SMC [Clostridiales Family XIII bacterium]
MYLKRIEISGFKSFAEPVNIDFKEGVTCIIGPNGSGKSNISDAMRWVLGEQSAKTLRGGKMEEIIFAGTELRRPKGMAEVTLVFDNTANILPIEYNEVAIKRRLFRSGESEYFINNNQCRLKDIRELIMDTGIGVDGYSFIGQGRVDKMVSDKPEARREIFEEAAGIIKYKGRKAEAQRKLDSAQSNLDRMNDIIVDIESRIGGLKNESEKAKAHAELSARYRELEINITLKNIETAREKNKTLKAQLEEAGNSIESKRAKRVASEESLSALRKRDSELETAGTALRQQIAENTERSLNIRSDALLGEEKRRTMDRDKKRLSDEIASLSARIAEEEARASGIASEKDVTDRELAALNAELADKLAAAAGSAAAVTELSSQVDERRSAVFDLAREKSVKETELQGNIDLMSNFDEAKLRLQDEIDDTASEVLRLEKEIADAEGVKAASEDEIRAITDNQDSIRANYERATSEAGESRQTLERLRIETEQLSSRKKTIEEMEANYEGYNAGVRALMKQDIPGIHGVVAELMTVDKGYETAIETALGATLQNIICEDDAAAKRGIAWLKENRAGRLTFLPVTSIRPRNKYADEQAEQTAGFDAYATDRVHHDDKYRDIFDYLLGGVIIASELDSAITMSKKNREGYRYVTLQGEIVTPAGALTGGAYKNKSASLLERRGGISELEQSIARLISESEHRETLLEELNLKSRGYIVELQQADKDSRDKTAELADIAGELKSLYYRLNEMNERRDRRLRELITAEGDRERSGEMNDALRREIEAIGEKIAALEAEAQNDNDAIGAARIEAEHMAEAVTEVRLRVAAAGAEQTAAADNAARAEAGLLTLKREQASKQSELGDILAVEQAVPEQDDLNALAQKLEAEKQTYEARLETVVAQRRDVRERIEENEYALTGVSGDIEREAEQKNAMEVEIGRQETRLANWKDKLFDEFELSYMHALDFKKDGFVMSTAVKENREIKEKLRNLGEVNPGAIRDYEETSTRYEFLTEQQGDILSSMADYNKIVTDMDKISKEKFKLCFDDVVTNFDETFKLLFGGGKGELRLEDENDPLESGIIISVRPPGKTGLVNIDSYSGGEKSMIAIALMFAILKAKPSPFCILDEIDAALDETNIHRFANYVVGFKDTQFALVTHQRSTMEYADALFGVTMQEQGVTSILSLLLGEKQTEDFASQLTAS